MTDLSKLTAKDFSDAMHKGWRGLGWNAVFYFSPNKRKCCAIGAISRGLEVDVHNLASHLYQKCLYLGCASDRAGNKRAAMKAVDAILLNTPAVRGGAK